MKKIFPVTLFFISTLFSGAQQSWLRLTDFPGNGKVGCSSFSLNGKGYMGLGYDSLVQGRTEWYEYDPALGSWSQKASLPSTGRWTCVNIVIGNKGYVITGATNGALTNQTWEYDASLNAWTSKSNFPGAVRQNAAGFSIGNKGYVGTGYIGSISMNDFYEYNPATDVWTSKANFPGAERNGASGFSIGSMGYMGFGNGTSSTVNYNDFYEYDPSVDSWTQMADFPIRYLNVPTTYSSASVGYVLCGYFYQNVGINHNPLNTLYSYDPQANAWFLKGSFRGLPRGYAGGFSLTNDIYICAGAQSNDGDPALMLTDFWKLSNGLNLLVGNTSSEIDFTVFPNPATSTINFDGISNGKKLSHIRIYDAGGRLVITEYFKDKNQTINVSRLPKGIYFIELITKSKEVLDSRFLKE